MNILNDVQLMPVESLQISHHLRQIGPVEHLGQQLSIWS
jgi:hypothetical protein